MTVRRNRNCCPTPTSRVFVVITAKRMGKYTIERVKILWLVTMPVTDWWLMSFTLQLKLNWRKEGSSLKLTQPCLILNWWFFSSNYNNSLFSWLRWCPWNMFRCVMANTCSILSHMQQINKYVSYVPQI